MSEAPDLFDAESRALQTARLAFGDEGEGGAHRHALGELMTAYERLLRETRRMVRRSDRAELEMNQLNQRLQDLTNQLEYRATHDPLTGVLNRAAIIERSNRYLAGDSLALVVLDIDHFKRVNDSFGHPAGDTVICGVVQCLKGVAPSIAHIGRVGGEEFTALLPGVSLESAAQAAEGMRKAIAAHDFGLPDKSRITASFGVSWQPLGSTFDAAYGSADEALYQAKRRGRNQVARAAMAEA